MTIAQSPGGFVSEVFDMETATDGTYNYTGFCDVGTAANYQVMRETIATGVIRWANNGRFNVAWADRAAATYGA